MAVAKRNKYRQINFQDLKEEFATQNKLWMHFRWSNSLLDTIAQKDHLSKMIYKVHTIELLLCLVTPKKFLIIGKQNLLHLDKPIQRSDR